MLIALQNTSDPLKKQTSLVFLADFKRVSLYMVTTILTKLQFRYSLVILLLHVLTTVATNQLVLLVLPVAIFKLVVTPSLVPIVCTAPATLVPTLGVTLTSLPSSEPPTPYLISAPALVAQASAWSFSRHVTPVS